MNEDDKMIESRSKKQADALIERLIKATLGVFDIFSVYLGNHLGYYQELAQGGSLTSSELAARTNTHERYVREWLEQQTVAGFLEVEDESVGPTTRRYFLPLGHAEVLTKQDSLNYLAPLAQLVAGAIRPMSQIIHAFRSGEGVPFSAYGDDARQGESAINRVMYLKLLGKKWLSSIHDLHRRLRADPPARVLDVGCGTGWSSIAMAQAYPKVQVDGLDLDEASIEIARVNASESGVADRVSFHVRDASDPGLSGHYDLVTALECVHDMSDPVGALTNIKRLTAKDGTVLVMDERVRESFSAAPDEVEQFMYGFSLFHCLPAAMVGRPSAATGAVMRKETLKRYALEAGFRDVEILTIEHPFLRFYLLQI